MRSRKIKQVAMRAKSILLVLRFDARLHCHLTTQHFGSFSTCVVFGYLLVLMVPGVSSLNWFHSSPVGPPVVLSAVGGHGIRLIVYRGNGLLVFFQVRFSVLMGSSWLFLIVLSTYFCC